MADPTVREARERIRNLIRQVLDGVDRYDDYCGHPVMPGKLAEAAADLLAALDREDEERRRHAERLVNLAALRNVSAGEHAEEPEEAGP